MNQHIKEYNQAEELLPSDQKEFITELFESFEKYSNPNNEYFPETLSFLSENCFLDPLVCSLRAILSQGYISFPEFVQYNREKGETRKAVFEQFTQSFLSIIYGVVSKTMDDKISAYQGARYSSEPTDRDQTRHTKSLSTGQGETYRLDEATRSTMDQETNLNLINNPDAKPEVPLKQNHISSVGYTNRVNTLCTSEEKENEENGPLKPNYRAINAITPRKEDLIQAILDHSRSQFVPGEHSRSGHLKRTQTARNSSMVEFSKSSGKFLRNSSKKKINQKRNSVFRKKGYGPDKFTSRGFTIPTMMHLQESQRLQDDSRVEKKARHICNRYGPACYESTSNTRENVGEYSYGKGGSTFGKSIKKCKFDENKEMIYSPGPGRYESHARENSAVYSFGKQKKDISFAKFSSRDIPSPGKYKVKRDFLSKVFKRHAT